MSAVERMLEGYSVRPWEPWTEQIGRGPWSGRWSAKLKAAMNSEAALTRYLTGRDKSIADAFTLKAYAAQLLIDYRELAAGLLDELAELHCRGDEVLLSPDFGALRRNGEWQFLIVASAEARSFGEFERRAGEFAELIGRLPVGEHPKRARTKLGGTL